jgi:hypothetical protein
MPYIGKTTDGFGVRNRFVYLASSGDTSVSGADANGATLTFTDGAYVDVYLNGVLLKPTTDYNTSTANTIAGLSALNTNDEITVVVYDIFTVADMVSATSGGTFSGAVEFASGFTASDGATITTADNDPQLTLISTDADSGVGPRINLYRNSSSPADDDALAFIYAQGENDADELTDYGFIGFFADDVTDGSEDGNAYVILKKDGTSRNRINLTSTETVFNDDSVDLDFRIETDGKTHAFFVEGSSNNLAMGTTTPTFATGNGLHMGDDFYVGFGDGNGTRPDFQLGYTSSDTRLDLRCGTGADTADIFFTTGGKIEIGTASATQATCLHTLNDSTSPTIIARNNNGGSKVFQGRNANGSESSHITQGGVASFPNGVSSDETLKNVKGVMNDGWNKLKDIQPKSYTWKKITFETNKEGEEIEVKTNDDLDSNIHYGVIAQDLKKIIPDLAYGKEGGMSVDYNGLLMIAINTIKELEARIKILEEA